MFEEIKAKGKTMSRWLVLFSFGSEVTIFQDDVEFTGFTKENYEFPQHRIKEGTDEEFISKNKQVWDYQSNLTVNNVEYYYPPENVKDNDQKAEQITELELKEIQHAVKQAFNTLIRDGYPYPGGQGADRVDIPVTGHPNLQSIFWPSRSLKISNFVYSEVQNSGASCAFAGELRRYDFMFPKALMVINPNFRYYLIKEKSEATVQASPAVDAE